MDKEVRKLVTSLQRIPGVEIEEGGSGHYIVSKGGAFVVSLSATPSDVRWKDNALAALRRNGITPGVRQSKRVQPPPKVKQMDVRAELAPIRARRGIAQFARFAQQLGEIRGMRTFASVESAENSIHSVANGKNVSPWAWILIMAALVEWRRRQPEQEQTQEVERKAPPTWEQPEQPGMKLVIDLGQLTVKLAEFGITLEVQ